MLDHDILASFVASRVCHDLVSPISSIVSAIDLLDGPNGEETRAEADALLREGAAAASARVEFLRYAFGSMGLTDGAADIHEAKRITERFVATHKPNVAWDLGTAHVSYAHARLMMNMVLMGMGCIPRGGTLTVRLRETADGLEMAVIARGDRARLPDEVACGLRGETDPEGYQARTIQPFFTWLIGQKMDARFETRVDGDEVTLLAAGVRTSG